MRTSQASGMRAARVVLSCSSAAAQLEEDTERAMEVIARAMFEQDQAVAQAMEHLTACCDLLSTERLDGWTTERAQNGDVRVTYVALSQNVTPLAAIRASVGESGDVNAAEVLDPPTPLGGRELDQYRARMLATNSGVDPCSDRYNTVALPASGDEWTICVLRATNDPDVIPGGIHYKFRISASGDESL